jgi:ABC-type sugar transport system ATPase subunit
MNSLHLKNITAQYGETAVLRNVSLSVRDGEFLALLGPSGCGKSTLLKIIAGLLMPAVGDVRFGNESVLKVPAEKREAVMVFQKPLLFPYLTVAENVAFGLKMRQLSGSEIRVRVTEALQMVQLNGYESRKPNELSGGQEQRVSMARALVTRPRLLLLDEPFSALDENLRVEMRQLVRQLQQQLKITTVFVTHDQAEAALMADRIALLMQGKLEQTGVPRDFYLAPATARVAQFFGWKLFAGKRRGNELHTVIGTLKIPPEEREANLLAGCRPENFRIGNRRQENKSDEPAIPAKLVSVTDLGTRYSFTVALASGETVQFDQNVSEETFLQIPASGAQMQLHIPPSAIRIFTEQPE